jgi:hypothetical protein
VSTLQNAIIAAQEPLHHCSITRNFDDVANWEQLPHEVFINAINDGKLLPVWANESPNDTYMPFTFGHLWEGDCQIDVMHNTMSKVFDKRSVISNVDLSTFPVKSTRHFHTAKLQSWHPRNFQLVGGIPLPFENVCVVNTTNNNNYTRQTFVIQHPTNWERFNEALNVKFLSAGGELADVWEEHRSRYVDTIIKPLFDESSDMEDCVSTHFAMSMINHGQWYAHRPEHDIAVNDGGTRIGVRFPQTYPGNEVYFKFDYSHEELNYSGTTFSSHRIFGVHNGINALDPGTKKFFDHFVEIMGYRYEGAPYAKMNVNDSSHMTLAMLYSKHSEWNDFNSHPLRSGGLDANGNVVYNNGDPVDSETLSITAPADPMLGMNFDNTTAVWRKVMIQMKDALESDVD